MAMPRILDPEGAHLAALRRLGAFAGRRMLEFGCGDGGSRWASQPTPEASSRSTPTRRRSKGRAARCRQNWPSASPFGVATAQEIQLESRSFDLARGVERELVAGVELDDTHMVAQRIEATDLLPATLTLHQKAETRKG
jgi:hypothetical protein